MCACSIAPIQAATALAMLSFHALRRRLAPAGKIGEDRKIVLAHRQRKRGLENGPPRRP
jgi:hypothetical protein